MPDPTEIASPLRNVIARLIETPIEGPVAQMARRFDGCSAEIIALVDTSGSMGDVLGSLGMSKYEQLKIALGDVRRWYPRIRIVTFDASAREVTDLPAYAQGGATDLAGALKLAARWKPRKTVVISDGLPTTGTDEALAAARALSGSIDTIYCGPDGHDAACDFLRSLAKECAGVSVAWNGYGELGAAIRGLLPAPE